MPRWSGLWSWFSLNEKENDFKLKWTDVNRFVFRCGAAAYVVNIMKGFR